MPSAAKHVQSASRETTMTARMKNPAAVIPAAMKPIMELLTIVRSADLPASIVELTHLRASQINGCSSCVDSGTRQAAKLGESPERLAAVVAWRHTPYFTDAERAALALTESVTRLSDSSDPVPDSVWNEATRHFDESALAALLLSISVTNVFNRLNVATGQVAGSGW